MMIQKLATEIFKLAQQAPNTPTSPDAQPEIGEEQEIEYESLPLSIKNTLTKIRLRPANYKKIAKVILNPGISTYRIYFKQTRALALTKRNFKMLETDRNFESVNFQEGVKIMYIVFNVLERAQVA